MEEPVGLNMRNMNLDAQRMGEAVGMNPQDLDGQGMAEPVEMNPRAIPVGINTRTVKVHQCSECGFSSPYKNTLKVHMVKDHGQGSLTQKPFQCHLCSYQTFYRGNLEKHIRIHTGERPYQCRFCGKQFSSQSNKKSHENRHQGFHKLKCPYQSCGYFTNKVQEMSGHLASSHPGGPLTMAFSGSSSSGTQQRRVNLKVPGVRKSTNFPTSTADSVSSSSGAMSHSLLPSLSQSAQGLFSQPLEPKEQREHKLLNFLATQMNLGMGTNTGEKKPILNPVSSQGLTQGQLPPISSFHPKTLSWHHPVPSLHGGLEGRQSVISLSSDEGLVDDSPRFESRYDACSRGDVKPNLEELALQAVEHLTKQINKESQNIDATSSQSSPYKSPDSNVPQNLSLRTQSDSHDHSSSHSTMDSDDNTAKEESGKEDDKDGSFANEPQPSPSTTCHPLDDEEAREAIDRLISSSKLFRCPHCNILFPEYSMFVFHMGCHGESNPYQCHFCKVNFSDKFGFLAHFMQCYKY